MADRPWLPGVDLAEADSRWRAEKSAGRLISSTQVHAFLDRYYQPVVPIDNLHTPDGGSVDDYIEKMWYGGLYLDFEAYINAHGSANNSTLIVSPDMKPIPGCGGRFGNVAMPEHYGWDPAFIDMGLRAGGFNKLANNQLEVLAIMIMRDGYVRNGNRTYYQRPQLPFFSFMLKRRALHEGPQVLTDNLHVLLTEYNTWMEGADDPDRLRAGECRSARLMPDGVSIANDLWDDQSDRPRLEGYREDLETARHAAERGFTTDAAYVYKGIRKMCALGHDMSSRGMAGTELASVDTADKLFMEPQALLLHEEELIRDVYLMIAREGGTYEERNHAGQQADMFQQKAAARRHMINTYFFNAEKGFYFDWNMRTRRQTETWSAANGIMLLAGVPDQRDGDRISGHLKDDFLGEGGLRATLNRNVKQQWDGDRSWAHLVGPAIEGAIRYSGRNPDNLQFGMKLGRTSVRSNTIIHKERGIFVEKVSATQPGVMVDGAEYKGHVDGQEIPCIAGFGPTNGVHAWIASDAYLPGGERRLAREEAFLRRKYPELPGQLGLRALRAYDLKR